MRSLLFSVLAIGVLVGAIKGARSTYRVGSPPEEIEFTSPEIGEAVSSKAVELSAPEPISRGPEGIFFLIFGGSFTGLALYAIGNMFNGWPVAVFYFFGSLFIQRAFQRNGRNFGPLAFVGVYIGAFLASGLAGQALGALAANGDYGLDNSTSGLLNAETCIAVAALWLVVGVPHRAHLFPLDLDGKSGTRETLLNMLTRLAAVLTGVYILLLHFGGGPLSQVDGNALAVGTIFTMALVTPVYKNAALALWRHGANETISLKSARRRWRSTFKEGNSSYDSYIRRNLTRERASR